MNLHVLSFTLLTTLLAIKPNIYKPLGDVKIEKNAVRRNQAGTFQQSPFSPNRPAGRARFPERQAGQRGAYTPNFGPATPAATAMVGKTTTFASAAAYPWAGKQASTESAPHVLVATVMTTITKYAVLTSTLTNNIIELMTTTQTETETLTRHSTRTIQVISTQTTKFTITRTSTETETTTQYELVPYTITEIETMTKTIENVVLTTFTIPASTIHKTLWSTSTLLAATVTLTEVMQPFVETVATETWTVYATSTVNSVKTVTVEAPVPQRKIEPEVRSGPILYDYDPLLDYYDGIDGLDTLDGLNVEGDYDYEDIEGYSLLEGESSIEALDSAELPQEDEPVEASNGVVDEEDAISEAITDISGDGSLSIVADINNYPLSEPISEDVTIAELSIGDDPDSVIKFSNLDNNVFDNFDELPSGAVILEDDDFVHHNEVAIVGNEDAQAQQRVQQAIKLSPFNAAVCKTPTGVYG